MGKLNEIDLWNVLDRVDLRKKVENQGGLEGVIEESGRNLSVGEAQRLCLGRAMLKNPKILILDEVGILSLTAIRFAQTSIWRQI